MSPMPFTVFLGAYSPPFTSHKRNLFLRIVRAIAETKRRRAEREIAAFWARHDGQLSDGFSS